MPERSSFFDIIRKVAQQIKGTNAGQNYSMSSSGMPKIYDDHSIKEAFLHDDFKLRIPMWYPVPHSARNTATARILVLKIKWGLIQCSLASIDRLI